MAPYRPEVEVDVMWGHLEWFTRKWLKLLGGDNDGFVTSIFTLLTRSLSEL
jgi:hypothetical protein